MQTQKVSKKLAASIYREVANNFDKYGHVKNKWGSKYAGFCAMGSLGHVCDSRGVKPQLVRETGGNGAEWSGLWGLTELEDKVLTKLGLRDRTNSCSPCVEDVNDHPDTTKEDMQRFFRTLARALEHGGKL